MLLDKVLFVQIKLNDERLVRQRVSRSLLFKSCLEFVQVRKEHLAFGSEESGMVKKDNGNKSLI